MSGLRGQFQNQIELRARTLVSTHYRRAGLSATVPRRFFSTSPTGLSKTCLVAIVGRYQGESQGDGWRKKTKDMWRKEKKEETKARSRSSIGVQIRLSVWLVSVNEWGQTGEDVWYGEGGLREEVGVGLCRSWGRLLRAGSSGGESSRVVLFFLPAFCSAAGLGRMGRLRGKASEGNRIESRGRRMHSAHSLT